MVFKRYIKRGSKKFGPYYYESKRVNGKIKSIYVGNARNKELIKKYDGKKKTSKQTRNPRTTHKPKKPTNLVKNQKSKPKESKVRHKSRSLKQKTHKTQTKKSPANIHTTKKSKKVSKVNSLSHHIHTKKSKTRKKNNLKGATVQELISRFNEVLMKVGPAITMGQLHKSIELYEELTRIYNKLKRKVPYPDSMNLYNTIKQVYEDINNLKQEGL